MKVLALEAKGSIAHFRRPDTLGAHATYPFIPRTTIHGLLAAIIGRESLEGEQWCGLELLSPVRTTVQELSMHGKTWLGKSNKEAEFNRPTSIELVIKPRYLIYYSGSHLEEVEKMVKSGKSYFHTYLGCAYCLTFPRFVSVNEASEIDIDAGKEIVCQTIVPSHAIAKLIPDNSSQYGRVGAIPYEHIGERKFRGSLSLIYEVNGGSIRFIAVSSSRGLPYKICRMKEDKIICLW